MTPTAAELRTAFDAPEPLTLGLEEELMLLDRETLDLLPRAAEVIDAAGDDRFKLELPAAQLELSLPPERSVPAAAAALAAARRDLIAAAEPIGRLATAGVHPFAAVLGELNSGERYDLTRDEYGDIARSQLVCALQVHVAVGERRRRARGLQRAAPVAPAARRARRQRALPRRARHRHGLRAAEDRRAAAAPGHPARDRVVGRARRGAALGRRVGRGARAAALVVGAAPAPRLRDARGARARRAGHGRGRGRGRRGGPRARRLAARARARR